MIRKFDREQCFAAVFDPKSGFYARSGVIKNGRDTGKDPFMASFPELIDVGVMGSCEHGTSGLCLRSGVQCYQSGATIHKPNMSLENFQKIVAECRHKTFQVALGGRGDPDTHPDFATILKICRDNDIVPNYTTSGFLLDEEKAAFSKQYCGAVAVSWYGADYTTHAIQLLLDQGVKTNIHCVLSRQSLPIILRMLVQHEFPSKINAIVFLLHKPVGSGTEENVLTPGDAGLEDFFGLIDRTSFDFKIGFDSCCVPGLLNFTRNIDPVSIDTCEAARWSMYISADMKAYPCSFDQNGLCWDISDDSIENAWHSAAFNAVRNRFKASCPECGQRDMCLGGCPVMSNIALCDRIERMISL